MTGKSQHPFIPEADGNPDVCKWCGRLDPYPHPKHKPDGGASVPRVPEPERPLVGATA